jgi:glutamine amidotransferase
MMRIAVLDFGAGNLHSLTKALALNACDVRIESNAARSLDADALILPGVGAFGPAASALAPHRTTLRDRLAQGLPCLGICLGMQLLFDTSEEAAGQGLGLLTGRVRRLAGVRLPQMGWNRVEPSADPLFDGIKELTAYYANSYVSEPADAAAVIAWSACGKDRFPAAVRQGRVWGVQFHPEKSAAPGLRLLRNFVELAR